MNVIDLFANYLVALKHADRAFERDQKAHRREPSEKFLKAQERLERARTALGECNIRPFTGWGLS